jgi:protein-tyrosine-phosphatase
MKSKIFNLEDQENMRQDPIIVFVCEHGAAKSIIAAAYFNQFAQERKLLPRAIARGIHPDSALSAITVAGLHEDGLTPNESIPQKLSLEEIAAAEQVVSFCELPAEFQQNAKIEQWNDIPPVSENYERARDIVVKHLDRLINHL